MEKPEKEKGKSHLKHIPKDAQVIMSIMKDMDITDYEPRVINQLLEFTYRYVTCILDDARIFANHAKKKTIDLDDVKLARDVMLERSFTTPPSREVLLNIARTKNNCPLPLIKPHAGLRLPPDRYCLSACNYKLKPSSAAKKVTKPNTSFTNPTSIKVQNKPVTIPVMKRSGTFSTIPKTQTVTIPKPVFKFSTTAQQKSIAKPKIQITGNSSSLQQSQQISTPSALGTIKLESSIEEQGIKRKFEDVNEDYDI